MKEKEGVNVRIKPESRTNEKTQMEQVGARHQLLDAFIIQS